jgi:membrane associated rhomboid family serine protease
MFFPFHDDNPTVRTPVVTVGLIALSAVSFLGVLRMPDAKRQEFMYRRGFVPARIAQLVNPQPIQVPLEQRIVRHPLDGRPIRVIDKQITLDPVPRQILISLVTCMFLHGGWFHLIGNMWFLWVFGNNVEDRLGPVLFLVIYLGGGLLASGCHWMVDPVSKIPVIGASGAVATVLGAYAITWPWARVHTLVFLFIFITVIDLPALLVLGIWFAGQLLSGTEALRQPIGTNVAWWAHIGGFLAGVVLMPVFSLLVGAPKPQRPRSQEPDDWW